jgi:type II secretory pathway component PulM
MKKYFAQLRPFERRLVIGVAVILFLVVNAWQVWPHFSDWSKLRQRLDNAQRKLVTYQKAVQQIPTLQSEVKKYETQGEFVALEDQNINFMRTIQSQAAASGVSIQNYSRQITHTNDAFFVEQIQNITVQATDGQLVDFLYKLGSGASMIRVRDLELQPDGQHYHLNANIRLVASYQKNPEPNPGSHAGPKTSTASSK